MAKNGIAEGDKPDLFMNRSGKNKTQKNGEWDEEGRKRGFY
jgi:hypothetical protein